MESLINSCDDHIKIQKGDNLHNYTMQVMDSIRTPLQREKFHNFLVSFHAENLAENNPQYSDPKKRNGTIMLFADESGKADCAKCHRLWYESKAKRIK